MLFTALIYVHLTIVALTITLFIVRYWWHYTDNPLARGWCCTLSSNSPPHIYRYWGKL